LEVIYDQAAQFFGRWTPLEIDEQFLKPLDLCVISRVKDVLLDTHRNECHNITTLYKQEAIHAEVRLSIGSFDEVFRDPAN
jgi:hypothetical protein